MRGPRRVSQFSIALAALTLACLPFVMGSGCGGSSVIPIDGGLANDTSRSTTGNTPPTFRFTAPKGDVRAELGDDIQLTWVDSDPDDDARITLLLDKDGTLDNGNEIPIVTGISEDDPTNAYTIHTGNFPELTTGSYQIVARVSDGVNPEVIAGTSGQLNLFAPGTMSNNISPSIVVTSPKTMLSAADGSQIAITYCGADRDNGEGNIVPDVIIMLDNDDNPLNDLFTTIDTSAADAATQLREICTGELPVAVAGGVVLGCAKDDDCVAGSAGTTFDLTVDATKIPQRADGEPYRVRVSMWDHTNPPVHGYAPGMVSITSLATRNVDLGLVGRKITGAKFIGFDAGARAGFTSTPLGDFDDDGAGDMIVVARFGRPYERGNVGSAYLVYGMKGQRYGSEIYLNSFGMEYRGCGFAMGRSTVSLYKSDYQYAAYKFDTPVTDGIVAVSTIEDLNGDGKPEILFGLPYVEELYDYHDDDPCDKSGSCYGDGLPNPLSTDGNNDDMTAFDSVEGIFTVEVGDENVAYYCSNDNDLTKTTPINQGYIFYVDSHNALEDTMVDLAIVGQKEPSPAAVQLEEFTLVSGASVPTGARLRGAWWDTLIKDHGPDSPGLTLDPHNLFGQTLGSMPDLSDGGTIPHRDNASEFLLSTPGAAGDKGAVFLVWGGDLSTFSSQPVVSLPFYDGGDCWRSVYYPDLREIVGAKAGDNLGYANRAGDFNRDGHQDILCGAPGADHGSSTDAGTVYVIFGRLDFGHIDLSLVNPPRMEIQGTVTGDRFGETQTAMGDVNNDGYHDIAFASRLADGPGGVDCGYVGVIFGGRRLTGENVFTVNQVGTSQLPGVVFYGAQTGGHAGATIADAGDFNHDGFDDLLICAPDETRVVDQQVRHGVAYLIFGGPHLQNGYYLLSDVGSTDLPGIVFISPYTVGTGDEAPIDWVGPAGDVDGDGFADILIGVSLADFVNPLEPNQRRIDAGEAYLIYGNNSGSNVVGVK